MLKIYIRILFSFFILNITHPLFADQSYDEVVLSGLPNPGTKVKLSQKFTPAHLKGIIIYPEDPLTFDFIVDIGDSRLSGDDLNDEAFSLMKYFLASMTIPTEELWVNLSPYESDRIIPRKFGMTEMGRDLLAQDYVLKQLTSTVMNPDENVGAEFWDKVYAKVREFGNTDIPINVFSKVWIVPKTAVMFEYNSAAIILESSLEVMLEDDYLALQKNLGLEKFNTENISEDKAKQINQLSSRILKEIIIPEVEKEVNYGKNFAKLRQIYNSMILATWYKMALQESLLGKVYADKNKIRGIETVDKEIKQKIYERYLQAFNAGVFDEAKEEFDTLTGQIIPKKYFSGGVNAVKLPEIISKDYAIFDEEMLDKIGSVGLYLFHISFNDVTTDPAMINEEVVPEINTGKALERYGGVDLNPAMLNLQIKRDPNGIPLPISQQEIENLKIDGFFPIILDVNPIPSLPNLLGINKNS